MLKQEKGSNLVTLKEDSGSGLVTSKELRGSILIILKRIWRLVLVLVALVVLTTRRVHLNVKKAMHAGRQTFQRGNSDIQIFHVFKLDSGHSNAGNRTFSWLLDRIPTDFSIGPPLISRFEPH